MKPKNNTKAYEPQSLSTSGLGSNFYYGERNGKAL